MTNAQRQFDEDYHYVRKLLLHGGCKLADAKMWLQERGMLAEQNTVAEQSGSISKRFDKRVDREIDELIHNDDEEPDE